MIWLPPGEPSASTGRPSRSTMVGVIEERGRLPGSTRLAIGTPSCWLAKEKSVSSLFSRKPPAISREPKPFSMVEVMESTLPAASTMTRWVVEGSSSATSSARGGAAMAWSQLGVPGATCGSASPLRSSAARPAR